MNLPRVEENEFKITSFISKCNRKARLQLLKYEASNQKHFQCNRLKNNTVLQEA